MKAKFAEWGIDLKWVSLFPHIDDFNGRDAGQNFLGSVSRTVVDDSHPGVPEGYVTKRRLTMTFCQRKVNEDTKIREACVSDIHDRMKQWYNSLPEHRNYGDIKQFAGSTHKSRTEKLMYHATHQKTSACTIPSCLVINATLLITSNLGYIIKSRHWLVWFIVMDQTNTTTFSSTY
jgi:hypothetical protein